MSTTDILVLGPGRETGRTARESRNGGLRGTTATARLHREELQFRVILTATYPFFLAAAVAQRMLPGRVPTQAGARRGVFGEAKAMAVSAIPFAFMG